jgi:4-nitrophenyl phosphatase
MIPSNIKALVLDMDGVVWKSDAPIGDLPKTFARIRERGLKFVFATNNGTKTPEEYRQKLSSLGVEVDTSQVVTSALAVAHMLEQKYPRGTKIIDRTITFDTVSEATLLVRSGVPFYATNTDRTFPTPRGEIPGAGSWLSVIISATGVEPIVAGKPFPTMMEFSLERLGTSREETLIVGDRLETDIASGQAAGCPTAVVLSGVSTRGEAEAWKPKIDIIAESLTELVR